MRSVPIVLALLGAASMSSATTPEARAKAIVAQMTLDEKIQLVHGNNSQSGYVGYVPAIPRLKIPAITMNDGPEGFRGPPGTSTQWPSGLSLAASWNTSLNIQYGAAMGVEFKAKGCMVAFGPVVNLARVPLGGRTFESLVGEDPYIGVTGVVPYVQALQGQGVIANAKHIIANNQEDNRHEVSANVDKRTLAEMYYPAFEAAVQSGAAGGGGALSVMCANNRVNNEFNCANSYVLRTVLKGRTAFPGWVLSDYRATRSTVGAALGGLDQQMPGCVHPDPSNPLNCLSDKMRPNYFGEPLKQAVLNGSVPESVLDDKCQRILYGLIASGLFDNPPTGSASANVTSEGHAALAREFAAQSFTLLTNRNGLLPLSAQALAGQHIAVIGAAAEDAPITGGGGSGAVTPARVITVLNGLQQELQGSGATIEYYGGSDAGKAASLARSADLAIVVPAATSHEGADRTSLSLGDEALAVAVAKAAPDKTVVLAIAPGPFLTPWAADAAATMVLWLPGQEEGFAAADVLFGRVDPGGRLPVTLPNVENEMNMTQRQYPGVGNESEYSEKLLVGWRWYQQHGVKPAFPFGHGLSYTTFAYSNLAVNASASARAACVTVKNTGPRRGTEVVQLYLGYPQAAGEPPLVLRGFEKLSLPAGSSAQVCLPISDRDISVASEESGEWAVFHGTYNVSVGASSADLRASTSVAF